MIVEGVGKYKLLGQTRDDAMGECFDKCAKLLGLGYPGGPEVEKLAKECKDHKQALKKYPLPKPLVGKDNCDFSFSGMKTAVKRIIDNLPDVIDRKDAADICCSFQASVADVVEDRLTRAVKKYLELCPDHKSPTVVVAGGVAANKFLRERIELIAKENNIGFAAPPLKLCTDNGVMVAWAGMERLKLGLIDDTDFPVHPRWPLDGGNIK